MATTGPFAFTDVLMQYFKNVTGVEQTGDDMDWMMEPRLIGDVLAASGGCRTRIPMLRMIRSSWSSRSLSLLGERAILVNLGLVYG
jgi:hypothetical protein